jgi:hypothetical protein
MSIFLRIARSARLLLVGMIALVLMSLFFASTPARAQSSTPLRGDLGDAPDSTNHLLTSMFAYPFNSSIEAHYPTVFDPQLAGPQGPIHALPYQRAWLGGLVSKEYDADLLKDEDSMTNINALGYIPENQFAGWANYDLADDALFGQHLVLPQCAPTSFTYRISGAADAPTDGNYVNVWLDWNRDGDWNDTIKCVDRSGQQKVAPEWAVVNYPVPVTAGKATSVNTPLFVSAHANEDETRLWMRITLNASVIPAERSDGSGPPSGYLYGETEDYLLSKDEPAASAKAQASASGSGGTYSPTTPDASYLPGY